MKTYTPSEIAMAIGVSASSIRNWTEQEELRPYLSDMAVRQNEYENAKHREYTIEDLYVLNTVMKEKTRHNSWQDVADLLEDGNLYKDLPASAALVMQESAAEGFADKIILHQRIEFLELTIRQQEAEIDRLRNEVEQREDAYRERVDAVREQERQKATEREQQLLDEVIKLNRQMARLELHMEMLKVEDDEEE